MPEKTIRKVYIAQDRSESWYAQVTGNPQPEQPLVIITDDSDCLPAQSYSVTELHNVTESELKFLASALSAVGVRFYIETDIHTTHY